MVDIVQQLKEYEKNAINYLLQSSQLRAKLMEEYNLDKDILKDIEITQIPFAAYETQLERFQEEKKELMDRHDAEKDKMRKHYRNIVLAVCTVLTAIIIGFFGTIIYILENYDIMSFSQDLTTGEKGIATIEDGIHYNTD